MQIVEIVNAISTSGCGAATVDGTGLLCESFSADFEDWEQHPSDSTKAYLVTSSKSVTVWHTFMQAEMVADERLTIGRTSDGRWITLVWECS